MNMKAKLLSFLLICMVAMQTVYAKGKLDASARNHLSAIKTTLNLNDQDISALEITDMYKDDYSGITHIWFRQTVNGIGLKNSSVAVHLKDDGSVVYVTGEGVLNAASLIKTSPSSAMKAESALDKSFSHLQMKGNSSNYRTIEKTSKTKLKFGLSVGTDASNIPTELLYEEDAYGVYRLVWRFIIDDVEKGSVWDISIDAVSGEVVYKKDMVIRCHFPHGKFEDLGDGTAEEHTHKVGDQNAEIDMRGVNDGSKYRVFPIGIESPSHGSRVLVTNPADETASPYGWHDTNGAAGAEQTTTRGNNVKAYADLTNTNPTGANGPNGGTDLNFDFTLNLAVDPKVEPNKSAAITNLFYWNNIMHDVSYQYGFTESAGNFQQNNYGKGGAANDFVLAEALDGAGNADAGDGSNRGNANFATLPDGNSGRMQMYVWPGAVISTFEITAPASIAGTYPYVPANFGPKCQYDVSGLVYLVNDGSATPTRACSSLAANSYTGKILLIDRGDCDFDIKVRNAQTAGAIGVIVVNNVGTVELVSMGGDDLSITIPSIFVSKNTGDIFKAQLNAGLAASMKLEGLNNCVEIDGDFDNGVIAHEYTHGISSRLTGGPSVTTCLNNNEQMGEGWSDFFALVLTSKPEYTRTTKRGIATYASGEPTTGRGIREFPYTTDLSVNSHVYDDVKDQFYENTSGQIVLSPHGVGSIWCVMLWEMYWNLVDKYGYSNDFYKGNGGNNIALRIVTEGLKLQPCRPGFVTGRNAILKADSILYGGANSCLIWSAFAKRGLGTGASQGASSSYTDGVQNFEVPATCNVTVKANFGAAVTTACAPATIAFRDSSSGGPTNWKWTISNGQTSNVQNPTFTFNTPGTYTVKLVASNSSTADSLTRTNYIIIKETPDVKAGADVAICKGETANLLASGGTTYQWTGGPAAAAYPVSPTTTTSYIVTGTTNGCSKTDTVVVTLKTTPTANAGNDVTICTSQSTTLLASGGTSYAWSNGVNAASNPVSPASTTSYIVTVTNAEGCFSKDTVVVTVSAPPVANAGADVAICAGQNTVLTASGGSTYLWSTGESSASITVSPAATTTYSVVVSVGTCSSTDSVKVTVNSAPSIEAGADQTICKGAAATLTATASGTVLWSTGESTLSISVSPIVTTKYFVTVTSGSGTCATRTDSVTVNVTQAPTVSLGEDVAVCTGASATLTATGADSYTWSNGATTTSIIVSPETASFYSVTGCSAACPALCTTDSVEVDVLSPPVADFTAVVSGQSVTFTNASTGATTYSWSFGQSGASSTEANPSHTYSGNGTFAVTLTADNGACSDSKTDSVTIVNTGIQQLSGLERFNIYPNPNKGTFTLEVNLDKVSDIEMSVFGSDGKIMLSKRFEKTKTINQTFDLQWLPTGVYIVDLKIDNERSYKKLIKY
jgi:PKD repeat protein